ncbi:uncharacterized protein LOC127368577 isoform X20 [Dicentrarchus labrax]|uniref:uncharacterized protein LOC127368577 isoform X20 n=1 Tax=Dicentrarchus labrax TaxID=13489 RepID=UPI0021F697EF|nr:uncharacterized protein LOC127368577 isoform X20 [Dicentrarchus labrax]
MSLFVILVLLFTAVTGQNIPSFTVRAGDEVTLPCENVIENQDKCDSTSWIVSHAFEALVEQLVNLGQMSKSDRLSVTANCSLVIKKVTVKDIGRYACRQFNESGQQQGGDAQVDLSVIIMTEQQYNDTVIFFCAVLTYGRCGHTVKWLNDDDNDKNGMKTLQYTCSSSVIFRSPHLNQKYHELLKCNVIDKSGQTLLCNVSTQYPCEKTATKSKGSTVAERHETTEDDTPTQQDWWMFLIVSVGLAALITIVVAVNIWTKTKGNRTQMDEHIEMIPNPAVTQSAPETSQYAVGSHTTPSTMS